MCYTRVIWKHRLFPPLSYYPPRTLTPLYGTQKQTPTLSSFLSVSYPSSICLLPQSRKGFPSTTEKEAVHVGPGSCPHTGPTPRVLSGPLVLGEPVGRPETPEPVTVHRPLRRRCRRVGVTVVGHLGTEVPGPAVPRTTHPVARIGLRGAVARVTYGERRGRRAASAHSPEGCPVILAVIHTL